MDTMTLRWCSGSRGSVTPRSRCSTSHGRLGILREHGLVELLVAEDRKKGRVYGLTEYGTAIWVTIETQQLV